jgi:hypothetical protein
VPLKMTLSLFKNIILLGLFVMNTIFWQFWTRKQLLWGHSVGFFAGGIIISLLVPQKEDAIVA